VPYADIMPPAGDFDRVIVLQRATIVRNSLLEPVQQWAELASVWAAKAETGGTEAPRGDETAATIEATFTIRYLWTSPLLSARDRLLYNPDPSQLAQDGLVFNIRAVTEIGRRVGLKIVAWARADQLTGTGGNA
jgi:head-tail adaptor